MIKTRSLALAMALLPALAPAQRKVDPQIPAYTTVQGIAGSLNSIGSDTLLNVMTDCGQAFSKLYPAVKFQVEGKGSASGPPALTAGTSQLAPMSRAMEEKEIDDFEKKHGYKPTQIKVAVDALAVFVHKDNPLAKLTLPEADAIFGKHRRLGYKEDVTTWGQLGSKGDWADKPIRLYGRNNESGTYKYFKDHVLGKDDYKDTVKEQPGSTSVVQMVAGDLQGIGYSGIGVVTANVKTLSLARSGTDYVDPNDDENVYSGKYPLARYLYVYVNKAPGKPLDPLVGEFLRFLLSRDGQQAVVKDGFLPPKVKVIEAELEKLGFPAPKAGTTEKTPQDAGAKKN